MSLYYLLKFSFKNFISKAGGSCLSFFNIPREMLHVGLSKLKLVITSSFRLCMCTVPYQEDNHIDFAKH